jgi:DNA-binding NarL/FixJ family response regulator
MSISISSALSTASLAVANSSTTAAATQTAQTVQPTTNAAEDTVKLSEAQQVYQLYNQGQAVSQIATTLSLTVSTVNSYLDISGSAT